MALKSGVIDVSFRHFPIIAGHDSFLRRLTGHFRACLETYPRRGAQYISLRPWGCRIRRAGHWHWSVGLATAYMDSGIGILS